MRNEEIVSEGIDGLDRPALEVSRSPARTKFQTPDGPAAVTFMIDPFPRVSPVLPPSSVGERPGSRRRYSAHTPRSVAGCSPMTGCPRKGTPDVFMSPWRLRLPQFPRRHHLNLRKWKRERKRRIVLPSEASFDPTPSTAVRSSLANGCPSKATRSVEHTSLLLLKHHQ